MLGLVTRCPNLKLLQTDRVFTRRLQLFGKLVSEHPLLHESRVGKKGFFHTCASFTHNMVNCLKNQRGKWISVNVPHFTFQHHILIQARSVYAPLFMYNPFMCTISVVLVPLNGWAHATLLSTLWGVFAHCYLCSSSLFCYTITTNYYWYYYVYYY